MTHSGLQKSKNSRKFLTDANKKHIPCVLDKTMTLVATKPTVKKRAADSDQKLSEAILYISKHCAADHFFGAVKLNKILFFADFFSYVRFGAPVTGADYMKLRNGPVPRRFMPVKEALVEQGRAKLEHRPLINGFVQKRIVAMDEPNISVFSGRDIEMFHEVIDFLRHASADDVSKLSHDRAWKLAKPRETIPYQTAFVSDRKPKEERLKRARELSRRHKWDG